MPLRYSFISEHLHTSLIGHHDSARAPKTTLESPSHPSKRRETADMKVSWAFAAVLPFISTVQVCLSLADRPCG